MEYLRSNWKTSKWNDVRRQLASNFRSRNLFLHEFIFNIFHFTSDSQLKQQSIDTNEPFFDKRTLNKSTLDSNDAKLRCDFRVLFRSKGTFSMFDACLCGLKRAFSPVLTLMSKQKNKSRKSSVMNRIFSSEIKWKRPNDEEKQEKKW